MSLDECARESQELMHYLELNGDHVMDFAEFSGDFIVLVPVVVFGGAISVWRGTHTKVRQPCRAHLVHSMPSGWVGMVVANLERVGTNTPRGLQLPRPAAPSRLEEQELREQAEHHSLEVF